MLTVMLDAGTLGKDMDFSPLSGFGETKIYESTALTELIERISNADIIIVNKVKLSADVLRHAKNLKLICETATGYDNIDVKYCVKNKISVTNTPAYSTYCVTQVTLSIASYLMTHIGEYRDYVHSGKYSQGGAANCLEPAYREFYGKTWGVIGYGNIGKAVAEVARALGCEIIVNKRKSIDGVRCVDIETLAKEADIISIHCPLTTETKNLVNKDIFALMKKEAIVINMARGAVWNECDVADAIIKGKISAIGCDVYSCEPFGKEHPFYSLLGMENVCFTPHMAWGGYETRKRCLDIVISNIKAFIEGKGQNSVY